MVIVNTGDLDTDYINGNYVNMNIPNDCVNRYIATQGPLQNTVLEYWRMVQQESSNFIVMLTTIMERSRMKCFQYWPQMGEVMQLSNTFSLKLLKETTDPTDSYVLRNFMLIDAAVSIYLTHLLLPKNNIEFSFYFCFFRRVKIVLYVNYSI